MEKHITKKEVFARMMRWIELAQDTNAQKVG